MELATISKPTKTIWVTQDGQRIKVRSMPDSHLISTIRYLRRNAEIQLMREVNAVGAYLDSNPPDGAWDAATAAENELLDMDAEDLLLETCPTYETMLAEAERRGLNPLAYSRTER